MKLGVVLVKEILMGKLPKHYVKFMTEHPEVGQAYRGLGSAVSAAGPLDAREIELVKIGIAVGARLESGVRSHTRKALEAGVSPEEIRHAVLQATTTVGFPTMLAGLSWIEDVLSGDQHE